MAVRTLLTNGHADPRRECDETLMKAVGSSRQPTLSYSSYAKTTIELLKAACPDLSPQLDAIKDRLQDLKQRVSDYTYLKAYNFSQSITHFPGIARRGGRTCTKRR